MEKKQALLGPLIQGRLGNLGQKIPHFHSDGGNCPVIVPQAAWQSSRREQLPWNSRCFCPGAQQPQAVASVSSETMRASSCSRSPPTKPTERYEEGLPTFGPQECRMRPNTELDACPTPSWDGLIRLSLSDYFQQEGLVRKLKRQSGRVKGWASAHLQNGAFSACGVTMETLPFPQTHSDHTSKMPAEAR